RPSSMCCAFTARVSLGAVAAEYASNQPECLEARVALAADDDVIVERNAERAGGLDDLFGHFDVGARRARVAGRMVVYQDHRGRGDFERALDDLAGIDRRVIDGPDLL